MQKYALIQLWSLQIWPLFKKLVKAPGTGEQVPSQLCESQQPQLLQRETNISAESIPINPFIQVGEVSLNLNVHSFRAGGIKCCLDKWKTITSDPVIHAMVQGCTIELEEMPKQHFVPKPYSFSSAERQAASLEIQKLLSKGVIEKTSSICGEFFSNIFLVPKKNGTYRLILNLKKFNSSVVKHHFKMDTLASVIQLMTPNCYMASIDLRDAYYSVPITEDDRKYLKFV